MNKVASLSVNTLSGAVFVLNINVEVHVLYGRIDLKMFFWTYRSRKIILNYIIGGVINWVEKLALTKNMH